MSKLPKRNENYSEWYNQLVKQADLAENSSVRGCMVIKPHGYSIWENMKEILDQMFKNTGHQNAYFPLLIPKSFFSKESKHVEGFAKECAIVTHYRLKSDPKEGVIVDPNAKLEDELIIRPTSETTIWNTYKNWINSYRDLPLLINQRANVMRWEMRTRAFLRTSEFLRQEGHTAHETSNQAKEETLKMLDVYKDFVINFLAIDPILGEKTENEKFAGAIDTYTFETMTQDKKALQSGTSHFLGQNFSKAFDVKFTNKDNKEEYVRSSSWGVSTRLVGGLIMAHSDDSGLILPPAISPIHIVIIPIFKTNEELEKIRNYITPLTNKLDSSKLEIESKYGKNKETSIQIDIKYHIDDDKNKSPGWKFNERELKGIPLRLTIGSRDLENNTIEVSNRITGEKNNSNINDLVKNITNILIQSQKTLLEKNIKFKKENTYIANNYDEFKKLINKGFVLAHRDGTTETELQIQKETNATIRCIPFDSQEEEGKCIYSGKKSNKKVLFAKAY